MLMFANCIHRLKTSHIDVIKIDCSFFSQKTNSKTTIMDQKKEEVVLTCFVCRKMLSTKGQHHCSKCRLVSYCSPICQKIHWKGGHKYTCREGHLLIGGNEVNDEGFYHRYWGFCFDCLDDKKKKKVYNTSYFCDGCSHAFICGEHEIIHRVCKKCRE